MATRTNKERYTQALQYLRTVNADLANAVDRFGSAKQEALGKTISLTSGGFWHTGSDSQHMAIRALLLCQQIYLNPPVGMGNWAGDGSETKRLVKNSSETQIKDMIKSFTRLPAVTLASLAQTARDISDMSGVFNKLTRTRAETTNWGGTINCYGAVKVWLYKSGLCSLQWLLNEGAKLNAYTCNDILGDGVIVKEEDLGDVQEGWIFNIHDSEDPNICHWGISLGNGYAAASNTTAGGMKTTMKDNRQHNEAIMVDFRKGNSAYGEFTLKSSVEVCKCTYKSKKVVVKVTNPIGRLNYY